MTTTTVLITEDYRFCSLSFEVIYYTATDAIDEVVDDGGQRCDGAIVAPLKPIQSPAYSCICIRPLLLQRKIMVWRSVKRSVRLPSTGMKLEPYCTYLCMLFLFIERTSAQNDSHSQEE